jgi:hypothetical protein
MERRRSIFRHYKNEREKKWRWIFVHKFLKYALIVPAVHIIVFIAGRKAIKTQDDIPAEKWNNKIRMFNSAFDDGVKIWSRCYTGVLPLKRQYSVIYYLKNLFLTIIMEDSAYKELFNIILIEHYQKMRAVYGDKQIQHIFYNKRYDGDRKYFDAWDKTEEEIWHDKHGTHEEATRQVRS